MLVFAHLRSLAEFRRRQLPFLTTIEDQDLVREIGHYQVLGAPITMKQLLMLGLGSVATVQRRLQRLKRLGVVQQNHSRDDGRVIELTLSPGCMRVFGKYEMLMAREQASSPAGKRLPDGGARHSCVLCEGDTGCGDMAIEFLREGMRQKQTCLVIGTPRFRDAIVAKLERAGGKRPVEGSLVYFGGAKSPESVLGYLGPIFEEAKAAGTTVCAVDNMSWTHAKMDFDRLMDYEKRVDPLIRQFKAKALCQYDVHRFSGPQLLRALKCHTDTARYPLMIG
jgi:MEDS: MEthanogen/methylotroph, DcmR Sensory domain